VVYWLAIGVYVAIAVLAIPSLHALRIEGVLLTVLMLLGVLLALMLMFAAGTPTRRLSQPRIHHPPVDQAGPAAPQRKGRCFLPQR